MDHRNTPAAAAPATPAVTDAALYDANITIVALQQQLAASEAATLRAQQVAKDRADEAEHHQATIRQLRVEIREAEARSMPPAPRPAHARLVLPVAVGSSVHQEVLVLRAENWALREQLMGEMAVRLELRFVFGFIALCGLLLRTDIVRVGRTWRRSCARPDFCVVFSVLSVPHFGALSLVGLGVFGNEGDGLCIHMIPLRT
jgi:hypothetical protein